MGAGYGFGLGFERRGSQHGLGGPGGAWRGLGDAPSATRSAYARRPRGPGGRCRADRRWGLSMGRLRVTGYGFVKNDGLGYDCGLRLWATVSGDGLGDGFGLRFR